MVLHYLTSIISVTGMHLFEALSNMKPLAEESSTFETQRIRVAKNFKLRKRVVVRNEDESDEESSSDESDVSFCTEMELNKNGLIFLLLLIISCLLLN